MSDKLLKELAPKPTNPDHLALLEHELANLHEPPVERKHPSSKGKHDPRNPLNDLTGSEWVYFLNSVETTAYPTTGREAFAHDIRRIHPSPKPPQLMSK